MGHSLQSCGEADGHEAPRLAQARAGVQTGEEARPVVVTELGRCLSLSMRETEHQRRPQGLGSEESGCHHSQARPQEGLVSGEKCRWIWEVSGRLSKQPVSPLRSEQNKK